MKRSYQFPSQLTSKMLNEDVDMSKFESLMTQLMDESSEGELKQEALAFVSEFKLTLDNRFISQAIAVNGEDFAMFCAKSFILYKLNTEKPHE